MNTTVSVAIIQGELRHMQTLYSRMCVGVWHSLSSGSRPWIPIVELASGGLLQREGIERAARSRPGGRDAFAKALSAEFERQDGCLLQKYVAGRQT